MQAEVIALLHLWKNEIVSKGIQEFIICFAFNKMECPTARYVFFPQSNTLFRFFKLSYLSLVHPFFLSADTY